MKNKKSNHKGFTLIEVMIVVIIIGILATLVVPKLIGRQDQALVTKARHDISTLENALKLYRLDNYNYPSTDQGLEALVTKPAGTPEPRNWKKGGYIERMPKDPWGNDYLYLNPGIHGDIDIYSLGADAQEGGEEMNADIGNWNLE
ncbi:MAG: type II secretion system major pseudopilin GspG [Gammaproteobacteria bacterium]|nr:type II secretion system major pseudopilin GspG [Gammaproteobacteria bacterium]MDH5594726.1 type II secretion system major pseudopilin GspG [Gammaproteobacteria bacterium]